MYLVAKTVVIVWTVIGLIVSVVLVNIFVGGFTSKNNFDSQLNGPIISFETFVNKYLPTGEVDFETFYNFF